MEELKENEIMSDNDDDDDYKNEETEEQIDHHLASMKTISLSFAPCDHDIADRIVKAVELIDSTIEVEKLSSTLDTTDITQKESTKRSLRRSYFNNMRRPSKLISILTPDYIKDLSCLDHFNECYLYCTTRDNSSTDNQSFSNSSTANILAPIITQDIKGLPNYIQMIQCHDVRPNCGIDKLFAALVNIVKSISPSSLSGTVLNTTAKKAKTTTITTTTLMETSSSMDVRSSPPHSYDVFLSYSSKLRAQAKAMYEILQYLQPDLRIFFDANELHVGIRWQQQIYQSLDNSKVVLFVLTPEFLDSKFCYEESAIASLLVREGILQGIVAVEAIPVLLTLKSSSNRLPREVMEAIVPNETPFQACQRVIRMLQSSSTTTETQQATFLETRHIMHREKVAELEDAAQEWNHQHETMGSCTPKICIIGHRRDTNIMPIVRNRLKSHLFFQQNGDEATTDIAIITGPGSGDDDVIHTIDTSHIIICVLSEQFFREPFFMNSLNVGLLRNRSDGGCLIPINMLKRPNHDIQDDGIDANLEPSSMTKRLAIPTYVRLAIDGTLVFHTSNDDHPRPTSSSLIKVIAATAKLSSQGKWNCHTTIVDSDVGV